MRSAERGGLVSPCALRFRRGDAAFHPLTHALIGWAIGHLGNADRPTRFWCLVASVAPDVDGLSLLGGVACYQRWHHLIAHNLLSCAIVTLVAARWTGFRALPLLLIPASFVSHLVGDYFGSGPGWSIHPYLPFDDAEYLCPYAWELASWQNFLITVVFGAVMLEIACRLGRTPLEFVSARAEREVVDTLRMRRYGKKG